MIRRSGDTQQIMTSFAVGEEAEPAGPAFLREVGQVSAPLDQAGTRFTPDTEVKVDVVVRTRKIGHFFPGGTVDAFDVWLELQGTDANGNVIFWSGAVEDDGRGPVEKGAHFYRSFLLDGDGNPIDKRNAWQARSLLYVRLIPPGAADVAHYRVKIPPGAKGPITLTAKLNYRKFSHYYTQFVYAGQPKPGQDPALVNAHYNSQEYSFDPANIPANVSGQIKGEIPNLPIVVLAEARSTLELSTDGAEPEWKQVVAKSNRERWNDWGIGLLLQGDLKGAQYAFQRVTEAEPEYADGWLNVARALIHEGETEAAKPYIEKAIAIDPKMGRAYFFKALTQKADGDYDGALASLRVVESMYPRDRVVLNQMGRILFLKREYAEAEKALQRVGQVDPEDLQMHYNLMLVYRGLGENEKAAREEKLFRRFKAEESAQAITARPRMLSPEDNNERQPIHEHESVALPFAPRAAPVKRASLPATHAAPALERASDASAGDAAGDGRVRP
jgi:tetratricopeptide (TPR) repeat protein